MSGPKRIGGVSGVRGYKGHVHSKGTPKAKNWLKTPKGSSGSVSSHTKEKGGHK